MEIIMKNKLLPTLASLIIGIATFAGNAAYADTTSGMYSQTPSKWCSSEAPNAFEPHCAGNIMEREGKAAYGEPRTDKMAPAEARPQFCSHEGQNAFEPNC